MLLVINDYDVMDDLMMMMMMRLRWGVVFCFLFFLNF